MWDYRYQFNTSELNSPIKLRIVPTSLLCVTEIEAAAD